MDLITAALREDPVLDMAVTHALLHDVAAGVRPPALRIFRPGPTVAFGRLDVLRPGFGAACDAALRHGFTPVVRPAGGHAAVYDEHCVLVEHATPEADVTAGLDDRFVVQSDRLRRALAGLGADARVGELAGEYCAGRYSINAGGRVKVAGIAQRAIRHGALATAVIVVGGGSELRALIAAVYAALEIETDPATAGALDEVLPGVNTEQVAAAVRAVYAEGGELTPRALDPGLLSAARALAGRHRPGYPATASGRSAPPGSTWSTASRLAPSCSADGGTTTA